MSDSKNRYTQIIEAIFSNHYKPDVTEIVFNRDEFADVAKDLNLQIPKNVGDILYTFRYRAELPKSISRTAKSGKQWIIRPAGKGRYRFVQVIPVTIEPSKKLVKTKILDSTPGIIDRYALSDEQALLAKIRYNRLVDVFTGLTCFSLQNHLRTAVPDLGQMETDELYIGLNKQGVHFVLPIQAKGAKERIGIVQIEQDIAVCEAKFPELICTPIAAQFMKENVIALFQLEDTSDGIKISSEKHYQLVPSDNLTDAELKSYRKRFE
jgi:hypothetical protein